MKRTIEYSFSIENLFICIFCRIVEELPKIIYIYCIVYLFIFQMYRSKMCSRHLYKNDITIKNFKYNYYYYYYHRYQIVSSPGNSKICK